MNRVQIAVLGVTVLAFGGAYLLFNSGQTPPQIVQVAPKMDTDEVRDQLERAGRLPAVRSDRRKAKAMRWLVDNVELVDEDGKPVSRDDLLVNQGEEDSE